MRYPTDVCRLWLRRAQLWTDRRWPPFAEDDAGAGERDHLQDHKGDRSYDDLKKFDEENLGPSCGPGENIDLCDEETKASINMYMTMSVGRLEGKIRKVEKIYQYDLPMMRKVAKQKPIELCEKAARQKPCERC